MKLKKLLVAIVAAVVVVTALSGCEDTAAEENVENAAFQCVGSQTVEGKGVQGYVYTYVHKETRVMYVAFEEFNCKGVGLTVMLDADGKPLLYEGELK